MNEWEHLFDSAEINRRQMLKDARQARLARAANTPAGRGSRLRVMLITLTVILLGMIAWWGQ